MPLTAVHELSDDEAQPPPKAPGLPSFVPFRRRASRGFKKKVSKPTTVNPQALRHLINRPCGCSAGDCFGPFRKDRLLWDAFVHTRKSLLKMSKLEQDKHVGAWVFMSVVSCVHVYLIYFYISSLESRLFAIQFCLRATCLETALLKVLLQINSG